MRKHGPKPGNVTGRASAYRDDVIAMNKAYRDLTGNDFYLYTSIPGDGQVRVVFTDGTWPGYASAAAHMRDALSQALEADT
jgi:hypothetical protein